jgi:hypothetical protein
MIAFVQTQFILNRRNLATSTNSTIVSYSVRHPWRQPIILARIRFWLAVFIVGLVLSGVTAFPLQSELNWLVPLLHTSWIATARRVNRLAAVGRTCERSTLNPRTRRYPFLAYGTDWLAFAHIVIAVAFIGPYIDPVRNKWVITFGSDRLRSSRPTCSHRRPRSAESRFRGASSIAASESLGCVATL